ncbi:MAG: MFS transporter [Sedimentisphaerales bacterium]|nr:MFS transporter [Sedimentisphaerales bacterium]
MKKPKYLTAPIPSTRMPSGIPYIVSNEAAERFSFYGMNCILTIFMAQHLLNAAGQLDVMRESEAIKYAHLFKMGVYGFPIIGALLADVLLGKYRTILWLSIVYCLGHLVLALDQTRTGLFLGLSLIVIGSGGIKPCVSAHVGDQFGKSNQHLLQKVFSIFYFAINLGSFFSTMLTPKILELYGPHWAFGIPGILMAIATLAFWLGRNKYVHVPAGGIGFLKETFSLEGLRAVLKLGIIYVFVAMFWSLFDQSASAWVLQAQKMDLHLNLYFIKDWLPSQIQAANPLLVMLMIPLFSYVLYPTIDKVFRMKPLRKICIGMFVAASAFAISAHIESQINGGDVFRYTSRATIKGVEAVNLIDGQTDGSGWSSADQPTSEKPQELLIALRERSTWTINAIHINAATALSQIEIVAILKELILDARLEHAEMQKAGNTDAANKLQQVVEILSSAAKTAKAAPSANHAKQIARGALEKTSNNTNLLDGTSYNPKQIALYTINVANLDQGLVPQLTGDKTPETVGWIHLTDCEIDNQGNLAEITFEPTVASHVLIRINSNYGANRVKIGEIAVMTTDPPTEISQISAADIWPNVAGVGFKPNIIWQIIAYVFLTAAEIMVSITCLEFSYTQAPRKMKSFIMSVYLLSISLGNAFVAVVNGFIEKTDGTTILPGANYYWFFTISMLVTASLFIFVTLFYKEKTYIQEEAPAESDS